MRVAQHRVLRRPPEKALLQVLHRIIALEPWIEHAVGKDKVGPVCRPRRAPRGTRAVAPDAVGKDRIEAAAVLSQPVVEVLRILQEPLRRPFQMNGNLQILLPVARWVIDTDRFHFVSQGFHRLAQPRNRFGNASRRRIHRRHDVQEAQALRRRERSGCRHASLLLANPPEKA